MKRAVYYAGKLLVKCVFGLVARIHVIGRQNANHVGGFLVASNHISHFDPFLISLPVRRTIDWMTMAEFFRPPALGFFLRSIDAFPAERDRADLKTIRAAIDRLKIGRVVGLFPEGGIRDGARSLLEGAYRSVLFQKAVAAVPAHAGVDRVWKADFMFSRVAKISGARTNRIQTGCRFQKSLCRIARKISPHDARSAAVAAGADEQNSPSSRAKSRDPVATF